MKLLGKEIKPGDSKIIYLELAKLHTRNKLYVPIIVERAKTKGPVLLLIGGIHGDEVNGVAIIRKFIKDGYNRPKAGTVICIPVFNIFGYLNQTRQFPDGRDLNRVFPGSPNGSLASQFAYQFVKEIGPVVEYVIDFHTGSAERDNVPQVRCVLSEKNSFELAKVFGAPLIVQSNYINKSIREALFKLGKTTLLFEGGKSKSIDAKVVECGVNGTRNVMAFLKMAEPKKTVQKTEIVIQKSHWIRAKHSGMLHLNVENGRFVEKNEVLAYISDPFGDFEKRVKATNNGFVICVNTSPIVNRGDALFHLSTEHTHIT